MKGNENNYYEILEVDSKATQAQIRDAYQKLKNTFRTDNNALYSMMTNEDIHQWMSKIEEAYHVLSDMELKANYDQRRGVFSHDAPAPVFNLNRTPPMQKQQTEDLLIAPITDSPTNPFISNSSKEEALTEAINQEQQWRGAFIRKSREIQRLSLEDLSQKTKISKSHLQAIEDESFDRLPAIVYLRGFLMQISKTLKIPQEPVVASYLDHYKKNIKT